MEDTISKHGSAKEPSSNFWREFFALARTIEVPEDFMADRPMNSPPRERHLFNEN
jgi:antitoxin VapB